MTTVAAYQERFRGLELAHAPFAKLHERALAAFVAQGFPARGPRGRGHEDWRYTNVSEVEKTGWKHERGDAAWSWKVRSGDASLVRTLDDDEALIGSVASLERAPFVALNGAFFQRGYSLVVPEGHVAAEPLFLTHDVNGGAGHEVHPRGVIVVKKGAKLTLIEEHLGEGRSFTNLITEVVLCEGASLEHHVWQRQGRGSSFIGTVAVQVAAGARYESFGLWLGGSLSRVDLNVSLDGEEASCRVDGIYVAREQHTDVHSVIDHRVPHCTSRQIYKGLMGAEGHAVFNGKVFVRPDAQKTDAAQTNHNLLLADTAEIDTKPQLEIYADDVKAAHGTTVGQLDEEQLFYLRSRGLSEEAASHMLTDAFALEVLDQVGDKAVRERATEAVRLKLRELRHNNENGSDDERERGGAG